VRIQFRPFEHFILELGFLFEVCSQHVGGSTNKGRTSAQQFIQRGAEAVVVNGTGQRLLAAHNFGRHVLGGADELYGGSRIAAEGQAEVDQLYDGKFGTERCGPTNEDVRGFDVLVEQVVRVDKNEGLAEFVEDDPEVVGMFAEVGVEGQPFDQLHNQEASAVLGPPVVIDFGQMRMVEGSKNPELVLEARKGVGVSRIFGPQHLGSPKRPVVPVAHLEYIGGRTGANWGDHVIAVAKLSQLPEWIRHVSERSSLCT